MVTTIEKPKSAFVKLFPELAGKVPHINSCSEVIAATEKLQELEVRLADVRKEIDVPTPRTSPQEDAEAILDGTKLRESGDAREELFRERDALPKAIELQRRRIQEIKRKLAIAACEELASAVKGNIFGPNLRAFEEMKGRLKKTEAFFDFLNEQGITADCRPAHWRITQPEISILRGGNFPGLEDFIEDRKKYWGLDGKK
jgi:hypothetical protein